jgi:16S rRNA pseudouridine516 synthase
LLADPAKRVDPRRVTIDGAPVEAPEGLLVLLHKPIGVVCSRDTREGPNVYDLLPSRWSRRNPPITSVGRLDKDTTGLLLLTDTGEWVHRWTSPRKDIEKTYEVLLDAEPDPGAVALFASGSLRLDGESSPCRPARLELLGSRSARLHLTEGRFHQVRRMFAAIGRFVLKLHRSRFGAYELGDLPEGSWKIVGPP